MTDSRTDVGTDDDSPPPSFSSFSLGCPSDTKYAGIWCKRVSLVLTIKLPLFVSFFPPFFFYTGRLILTSQVDDKLSFESLSTHVSPAFFFFLFLLVLSPFA